MNKWFSLPLMLLASLLLGCNGSSGENTNPASEPAVATNLTISLEDSQGNINQSYDKNATITAKAVVKDQFNQAISNIRVNFASDLGELSVDSAITDSTGVATINISNQEEALGAGTLSATVSSLTSSIDYEFISNSSLDSPNQLSVQLLLNGSATNQLKTNEQVQVLTTLLDHNKQPIANEIINLSADIGTLLTTTVLTNDEGQASTSLAGNEAIGAGVITVTSASNSSISSRLNYQIIPADSAISDDIRIGYFDTNNSFVEGNIQLSIIGNTISAGGTLGVAVDLVDSENNRINTPTSVSFTSNCVLNENAAIDETVFSIKGHASATYEDISCAGTNGTEDIIIASVSANGVTYTASATIEILAEEIGSIEFVSAAPNSIVIKGSGGQETSTVTFALKSALGNAIAQHQVDFSLDSSVGDISLSRESAFTNSQGIVTTQVNSGSVPTVVRVTASATMTNNGNETTVQTQSSELSVNTGLPEQSSMTIAATILNPEASTIGEQSEIRVWLADSYNNPVPDGTTINFTTEGGAIEPSCNTVSGNCAVTWTATEPYLNDHRSTILATTSGHETFFDANGNNVFDNEDGNAISNAGVDSGFSRQTPLSSGFVDMTEAWRDDNENGTKESHEVVFYDHNNDGTFNQADGFFNGPHCQGNKCDSNAKKATLRKALILIMASAHNPNYVLSNSNESVTYADNTGTNINLPSLADGGALILKFRFADSAMQTMPIGTIVTVNLDGGELQGTTSATIGNTAADGYRSMDFVINNPLGGDPEVATLTINIETPNTEATTYVSKTINLM